MRDDITSLHGLVDESLDMHSTQMSSLYHHHAEMMDIHDHRFMSLKTYLDDFETQLDCQDECFTQILESQHEMMDYLHLVFPPSTPYACIFSLFLVHPCYFFLLLTKRGRIL